MTICIISITDTEELARSLNRYLKCFLGPRIESYFMTYERNLLSGSLLRQADLIVLELLRRDDIGCRAEGLFAAEKWVQIGKRILIVSGTTQSDIIDNPAFWDLAAANQLHLKIRWLLENPPPTMRDFTKLKEIFSEYCRPMFYRHRS